MKSNDRAFSTATVFVSEGLVSFGLAYDLVWFYRVELSALLIVFVSLSLIIWCITVFILVPNRLQKSFGWDKKDWGLDFRNKRAKNGFLVFLIILVVSLVIVSTWEVRDLNDVHHIAINNSERHYVMVNDTYWAIYVSGLDNVTSNGSPNIYVWVDLSYFDNATGVLWAYWNGTSAVNGMNRTTEEGQPNFLWWTHSSYLWINETFPQDLFGNFTDKNLIPFSIPAQRANTTVEYMVFLRMKEGSDISFLMRGGDYTVQFSQEENDTNATLITQSHFLMGLLLGSVVLIVGLYDSMTKTPDEDFSSYRENAIESGIVISENGLTNTKTLETTRAMYPSTLDMVQRSDRLHDIKNYHRNTSGFFIGLSVAFLFYLQGQWALRQLLMFAYLGVAASILVNLYSLVISLSDDSVKIDGHRVADDMLPSINDENEFRFHIFVRTRKQLSDISKMTVSTQIGVYAILCGLIGDFVKLFIVPADVIMENYISRAILFVSIYLIAISILLFARWILMKLGVSYGFTQ